jgi:hypothetical protein
VCTHHRVVVRGERSLRRAVGLAEQPLHHASREECRGAATAVALRLPHAVAVRASLRASPSEGRPGMRDSSAETRSARATPPASRAENRPRNANRIAHGAGRYTVVSVARVASSMSVRHTGGSRPSHARQPGIGRCACERACIDWAFLRPGRASVRCARADCRSRPRA